MDKAALTAVLASLCCLMAPAAWAQTVGLSGMLGGKALVIVDGSAPKAVAAGESHKGVKIVSTQGDQAVIEIDGKPHSLRVGEAQRLGDVVVHGVEAAVSAGSMPYVLLGNTFLTLYQMTRANDQMVLERRY